MSDRPTVMKFGGTSLEGEQAFEHVAHIVGSSLNENLVVVVSAMSGVTDALLCGFQSALQGDTSAALQTLEYHFERHLKVAGILGTAAREKMQVVIARSRQEVVELLRDVCANRRASAEAQDAIVSQGERLSARLLTLVLAGYGIPATYVDARRCIITDAKHGNAEPLIEETSRRTCALLRPLMETKKIPVLGGFIAATKNRVTTTLGRGSSDYSATLFSAALGARETQIWTDVDGVMTADPALVNSARTVSQLSYEEAAELARLGTRVLHSKMIQPVIEQQIPIRILNSRGPERTGSVICARAQASDNAVKAIALKTNLTGIKITSTPAFVANGFLGAIRDIFERHRAQMQIVASSQVGVSLACEEAGIGPSLVQDLQRVGLVETKRQRAIISCVGEGLQKIGAAGKMRQMLSEVQPALSWHSASNLSLVSMVDADLAGPALRQLHQALFPSEPLA